MSRLQAPSPLGSTSSRSFRSTIATTRRPTNGPAASVAGVQYFCQQGVNRLAGRAGFVFPATLALAERLIAIQDALRAGDTRACAIYETIGTCFGYSVAHLAEFYDVSHLLVLGRVSSGSRRKDPSQHAGRKG